MKGIYWLILGLCVWFIPFIIIEAIGLSGDSEKNVEQVLDEIPQWLIYVIFGIALTIILKGVITIRKERKKLRENEKTKKDKKSRKK